MPLLLAPQMQTTNMRLFRHKQFLLGMLVILGMQFCHPVAVKAGDLQKVVMESSSIEEAIEYDAHFKHGLEGAMVLFVALHNAGQATGTAAFLLTSAERVKQDLLLASGLFPSAP